MDRIAIISDIHSNKTALEAVFADIESRGIDKIYCLGDLVIKGPRPSEVIDLIKEKCQVVLKGNCDEAVCTENAYKKKYWTTLKIGEDRVQYLTNLPIVYDFYLSGQLVRLFHSSPYGLDYIYNPLYSNAENDYATKELKNIDDMFRNTPFLGKKAYDEEPDIVGFGHLHTPAIYKYKNKTLFNAGSVGSPNEMQNEGNDDKTNAFSTMASYIILEGMLDSKELAPINISSVRVPYDIEKEIAVIEKSNMPGKEKSIFCLRTASTRYKGEN